jgi:hypothetical protein
MIKRPTPTTIIAKPRVGWSRRNGEAGPSHLRAGSLSDIPTHRRDVCFPSQSRHRLSALDVCFVPEVDISLPLRARQLTRSPNCLVTRVSNRGASQNAMTMHAWRNVRLRLRKDQPLSRRGEPSIPSDRLGRLTLLRHACGVTVGVKLEPIGAFFDGRHALRVGCMDRRRRGGYFPGTARIRNTCERDC